MSDVISIRALTMLTGEEAGTVRDLMERAAEVDGFEALNEAAQLHLRYVTPGVVHLLAAENHRLLGYGQLQRGDAVSPSALVVSPAERRRGIGRRLLAALRDAAGSTLRIWATGDTPAAAGLARRAGLVPVRSLMIMHRPLEGLLPSAQPPEDIVIRPFRPGQDENEWLRVNARAFAHHPEQGSLTRADLDQRMAEPWFDPGGFLVATRRVPAGAATADVMIGFHWTKQHPQRIGEVYVLGVDPTAGVRGLGRPLLAAGLAHLRSVRNTQVKLYVDADNEPAVRLYRGFGFTVASTDVMYAPSA